MPRTVTVDRVNITRVALVRDASGDVDVYCEYTLEGQGRAVQSKGASLESGARALRAPAVRALIDQLARDVAAAEQLEA